MMNEQLGFQLVQLTEKLFIIFHTYSGTVEKKSRSRMNAPLRISSPSGDQELEKAFIEEAEARNMIQLKGHRYNFRYLC